MIVLKIGMAGWEDTCLWVLLSRRPAPCPLHVVLLLHAFSFFSYILLHGIGFFILLYTIVGKVFLATDKKTDQYACSWWGVPCLSFIGSFHPEGSVNVKSLNLMFHHVTHNWSSYNSYSAAYSFIIDQAPINVFQSPKCDVGWITITPLLSRISFVWVFSSMECFVDQVFVVIVVSFK